MAAEISHSQKRAALFYNQIVSFLCRCAPPFLRLFLLPAFVLCGSAAILRADDSVPDDAVSVAREWLAEIDAGHYEQSYQEADQSLHDKMPQETWVKILRAERPGMGNVVSRQEISRTRHADGLEGVEGDFVVIGYRTTFSARPDELEYVVVKHEFGGWHGVGYDFGPEQVSSDPDAGPTTVTESTTNAPPTPTNGITVPAKRNN